jgi:ribonuclease P/MRP protein subunit POP1
MVLLAVQTTQERTLPDQEEIEMADLRGSINAFEIMGPKSSQIIEGALKLAAAGNSEDQKKVGNVP